MSDVLPDDWRPLRPAFCKLLGFPEHYSWEAIYEEVRHLSHTSDEQGAVVSFPPFSWRIVNTCLELTFASPDVAVAALSQLKAVAGDN